MGSRPAGAQRLFVMSCARKAWEGRKSLKLRNLSMIPRVGIPPGKAGPAARSESCVVVRRLTLRSVDSEVKGREIEPRKLKTLGAFVVDISGGRVRRCYTWSRRTRLILPGSKDTDNDQEGSPGTWEARSSPPTISGSGTGIPTPRSPRPRVPAAGSQSDARVVSPGDHEARRDGRAGVGAPHSSVEAGERPFRTLWSEGCRVVDRRPEPRRGHRTSETCHRKAAGSCEGQRTCNVTSQMREIHTSGSVGALGEQSPRATRPLRHGPGRSMT